MASKSTILFFASNPNGVTKLILDEEIRSITEKIQTSVHRDAFDLISRWAVRPDDLLQELNIHKPVIVHFSGHGSKAGELILMNDLRQAKPVSPSALKVLFSTLKGNIKLVVLNACYSKMQATAIADVIDCVVGMNTSISDQAAITFAASFYRAIGFGLSVKEAFEQGKASLMLEGIPEENVPELIICKDIDPASVFLVQTQPKEAATATVVSLTTDVLNSLHELDSAIRKTLGPLTRFDHIWSTDKREATIKEMEVLADTEVILPKVRQLLSQLEEEKVKGLPVSKEGMKIIDIVLTCGHASLQSLGQSDVTPWSGPHELSQLISDIRTADSLDTAESVRQTIQKIMVVVDRRLLREADELLGHFKGTM